MPTTDEGEMRECGEARRKKERQLAQGYAYLGRGSLPHSAAKKTANAALHFSSGDNGSEW